jgi:hypothetical protein
LYGLCFFSLVGLFSAYFHLLLKFYLYTGPQQNIIIHYRRSKTSSFFVSVKLLAQH